MYGVNTRISCFTHVSVNVLFRLILRYQGVHIFHHLTKLFKAINKTLNWINFGRENFLVTNTLILNFPLS